jgi:hypothetical protein
MKLTRDPEFIKSKMYSIKSIGDNRLMTSEKTIIEFPKYYEDKGLLKIEKTVTLYAIFAIIIDNKYSVSLIPTTINTKPLLINEVEREDGIYYQFIYGKNTAIIDNMITIRNKLLSYDLFDSFFMLNKIPWFMEYEDMLRILDNLPKYGESNLGANLISNEIIVSFITRQRQDPIKFYRQDTSKEHMYVDLNDVFYSVMSNVSRLGGSYFNDSLISAINQKEKEPTKLTNLVRR